MARIELITERDGLSEAQVEAFDRVVESRGKMIRPFEVLLHTPGLALAASELGRQIRYEGLLSDHDRELAIITTGKALGCEFVWGSHIDIARGVGVSESAIEYLQTGRGDLSPAEVSVVAFVRELCSDHTVSDTTHRNAAGSLGADAAVVELSCLVGYYSMLGYAMNAAGAC